MEGTPNPNLKTKREISDALYDLYVYIDAARSAWREDDLDSTLHWTTEAWQGAQGVQYHLNILQAAREYQKSKTTRPAA